MEGGGWCVGLLLTWVDVGLLHRRLEDLFAAALFGRLGPRRRGHGRGATLHGEERVDGVDVGEAVAGGWRQGELEARVDDGGRVGSVRQRGQRPVLLLGRLGLL